MKFSTALTTLSLAVGAANAEFRMLAGSRRKDGTVTRRDLVEERRRQLSGGNLRSNRDLAKLGPNDREFYVEGVRQPDPQAVYNNGSYDVDSDDRDDCDDDENFVVEVRMETGENGEDNGLYLVKDKDSDFLFVMAAPAMSLEKEKDYGTQYFCLPDTSQYHFDASAINGDGFGDNNRIRVRVSYQGDRYSWTDDGDFDYTWMSFDNDKIYDSDEDKNWDSI